MKNAGPLQRAQHELAIIDTEILLLNARRMLIEVARDCAVRVTGITDQLPALKQLEEALTPRLRRTT